MRALHALVLVGLSLGIGAGGRTALTAGSADSVGRAPSAAGTLEGVTWTRLESQSTAVFNLGPILQTSMGELRRWTLVVHLPGTPELLTNVPGLVRCDDVSPISFVGEFFSVELMPAAGKNWGTVDSDSDLVSEVRGLF